MLARFFLHIVAIFFPWVILFFYSNPGDAVVGLILQATILGWIPATIWAWQVIPKHKKAKKKE